MEKSNNEHVIVTIDRVEFKGKWVEFWFINPPEFLNNGRYHASSKSYKLMEAIERAELYDDVMSNGLRGKQLKWEKVGNNYEIVDFITINISSLDLLISSQEELEKKGDVLTPTGIAYLNGLRQARKIMTGWTSMKENESVRNTSSDS